MLSFSDRLVALCIIFVLFFTLTISLRVFLFHFEKKDTPQVSLLSAQKQSEQKQKTEKMMFREERKEMMLAARGGGVEERRKEMALRLEAQKKAAEAAAKLEEEKKLAQLRKFSEEEIRLLARIIVAEAEDQSYRGKVAVGAVVMNRVKSSKFPNTIRGVIYQKGQFSPISNGRFYRVKVTNEDIEAAKAAIMGEDPSHGSLFFYDPRIATDGWIFTRPVNTVIGDHNFAS